MAQVYSGRDTILNRPVVVKVISRRHRRKSDYARRLIQEAQAIAQWRHDNIVQVYYAGEEKGLVFIVMEYIDGPDLSQVLADYAAQGTLMPHDEALRIGRAVADALDYAHARGAIHRDVKPDNVIVARSGRVVLADFGLVIQAESDETGEMLGSAYYIAPEQAQSNAKTVPRSDLYALGVMLYEMLAGQRPFDDPSPMSVALQHVTQPPPSPRLFNPDLPERTAAVLLKALRKLPEERYANGRALLDALADSLKEADASRTAVSRDDLIGRQLDEYRLDTLLGQGGMARIYHGYDTRLKRHVAIKVIDAPHRAETIYRQRFEREAQAIAQLSHPNIVNVYRYGELSGLFYMAMQYVEGIDLRTWIDNYRRQDEFVPLPEVMRIMDEVCQALDYAHSKGIIHRDVKPANILVAEAGRVFLTDFGLVLRAGTATRGEIFGSPRYIAPEQAISSSGAVPQSDLYAVGVILYEMLTGRLPFDAGDPLNMAMQHMSETPPSPRELRPELSPALEAVLLQSLAKEPEKRYATGALLVEALRRAMAVGQPAVGQPLAVQPTRTAAGPMTPPAAPPGQTQKRELPPIPAAVVIAESPEPAPPPTVTAVSPKRRGGAFKGLFMAVLLIALAGAGWFFWGGGREMLADGGNLPLAAAVLATETSAPTSSPIPATATQEPAVTAVPPLLTPTATAAPTKTATAVPTASPPSLLTDTPTLAATATPSNTPLPAATSSSLPTATPLVIIIREKDGAAQVLIPALTFAMGAAESDEMAAEDERPSHQVSIDSFYMDQYEVTVAQYAAFLNENGGYVSQCNGFTCLWTSFETLRSYLTDDVDGYVARAGFADYPINNVSWHGANAYCAWAGGRLPTEAEWEAAARGDDGRLYPWGDEAPDGEHAVFGTTFADLGPVTAVADGASPFKVYGMAGSVWEWVADEYDAAYYASSPVQNPFNASEFRGRDRVLRGGGYDSPPEALRVNGRASESPTLYQNIPAIGFRCAQSVTNE